MRVFERIKQEARKEPKVIVLPELGMDKDGVVADAMARARSEGTAIPIGLTPEFIERSGKMDEFVDALAVRRGYALKDGDEAERAKARSVHRRS
jgi:phosphotransacetylase